jgi:hypothetical protein
MRCFRVPVTRLDVDAARFSRSMPQACLAMREADIAPSFTFLDPA